jgi:hypothetical protein
LLGHSVSQCFVFQIFVLIQPLLKLNYLQWVSGSGQHLSEERIGIKRNRRNQRIQLPSRQLRRLFCVGVGRGRHHLRLRLLRRLRNGRVVGRERSHARDGDQAVRWFKGSKAL